MCMYQRRIGPFEENLQKLYRFYTVQIFLSKRSGSGYIIPDPTWAKSSGSTTLAVGNNTRGGLWSCFFLVETKLILTESRRGPLLPSVQSQSPLCVAFNIRLLVVGRIRLLSSMTLRMQKNIFFAFFSFNIPAGILSSVLKIKFFAKNFC